MKLFQKKTSSSTPPAASNSPPSIWRSFERQGAWKSWTIVALLGLLFLSIIANLQLASQPPQYVVVDGGTGDSTLVRHSVSNDALLRFLNDKTKPPKVSIVRFAREFLHLALAVNSTTIENNWPAALALMSPGLRAKLEAESAQQKLVETYKLAQRKTELAFESIDLVDRTNTLLAIRAAMKRRVSALLDSGQGPRNEDRIVVDMVLEIIPATVTHPDGLRVVEWRLAQLENPNAPVTPTSGAPGAN